jgi:hypothetical protein
MQHLPIFLLNINFNLFTKINAPPIPPTKVYLMLLANIVSKASFAAGQKLFPVNAI